MKQLLDVVKVMTPFPHTVEKSCSLAEAERTCQKHDQQFLAVTINKEPVAIVTAREIELAKSLTADRGPDAVTIGELPLSPAYLVDPGEHLAAVVSHMLHEKLEAAVIVRKGRVVGMFTLKEAYEMLLRLLSGSSTLDEPPDLTA
jgi:signal-transduction protein with cAMP-binding, CBS, and nucleotidyltransferase domain